MMWKWRWSLTKKHAIIKKFIFGTEEAKGSGTWIVKIYNENNELAMRKYYGSRNNINANVCELGLPKGTYYAQITTQDAGTWSSDYYSLQIDFASKYLMTTTINGKEGLYYFVNGKVDTTYPGFVAYNNSWWYVRNGKVDTTFTSVEKGTVNGKTGWWRIENGKVNLNCNSVEKNSNGWWYIRNGKVDFNYTGTAKRNGVIYCVVRGKVVF